MSRSYAVLHIWLLVGSTAPAIDAELALDNAPTLR
jgi:hypothetical protein